MYLRRVGRAGGAHEIDQAGIAARLGSGAERMSVRSCARSGEFRKRDRFPLVR